jgi:hypothetical protein
MKKSFFKRSRGALLFGVMLLCFVLHVGLAAAVDNPVADSAYDFGSVKQGERVAHTFYFKNTLAVPLKINRIDLSTSGMNARAKPLINPGESVEIEISWSTAKVVHNVTAKATVHFAENQLPDLGLTLSGTVIPPIDAIPMAGFFISVFTDESAEREITLVNHQDHALGIRKLNAESPLFRASLETRTPGQVYGVVVRVPAGLKPGRYAETIRLETDDGTFPTIQMPVNLLVKDNLYANPEAIDFGEIDLARLATDASPLNFFSHRVMVKKRSGTFAIKSVASDVPGLRFSRTLDSASQSFEINIGLEPKALKPGAFSGTVRIVTTDPGVPLLTIAVQGRVK